MKIKETSYYVFLLWGIIPKACSVYHRVASPQCMFQLCKTYSELL